MVSHLEKEFELNGLEAPDKLQIKTVTQQPHKKTQKKPKPTCHHCKKPKDYRNQCRQPKRGKHQALNKTNSACNNNTKNGGGKNSNSNNKIPNNTNSISTNNQKDRKPRLVYPPCETCGKTNHSTEKFHFGADSPEQTTGRTESKPTKTYPKQLRWECSSCSPKF